MPLFKRFGRPGLLGAVDRTAVVAGTGTMTARAVNHGMDDRAHARYETQTSDLQTVMPGLSASSADSVASQLATLTSLHDSGDITDIEFAQAKRRVLEG